MKILALEFSSNRRSVAVAHGNQLLAEVVETDIQRSTGMVLLDNALTQAGVLPAEIDVIVVGLGPGSYGGIRSAIALAQGWQLGRGTRLLGISSVDALAFDAQALGLSGEVSLIIDAQRHEVYEARFLVSPMQIRELLPLRIVPTVQLSPNRTTAGPGASNSLPSAIDLWPRAASLAKLATTRTDFAPGEQLEPIYLRETSFVKSPVQPRSDSAINSPSSE